MTRLAPHVLKPLEPCPGCLDIVGAWLWWALRSLLKVGALLLIGYAIGIDHCPGPGTKVLAMGGAVLAVVVLAVIVALRVLAGVRQNE